MCYQCVISGYLTCTIQVESVAHACCEFMASHLHPSNCIGIRNFAELHGHRQLVSRADQFILDNFMSVAACEEFCEMTAKNLEDVISSSYLNVRSEVSLTQSLLGLSCLLCKSHQGN